MILDNLDKVCEKIENLEQKIQELTEAWEQVSSDLEQSQG